jgi:hypothetical protein
VSDRQAGRPAGGQRGERVEHVVAPRHRQLDRHAFDLEPRSARHQLESLGAQPGPRPDAGREHLLRQLHLGPHHPQLRRPGEVLECLLELAQARVGRMVVQLDVRDHRHVAPQLEEGAVRLVGLDHRPLPRPPDRVGARGAQLAADQERRVVARASQRVRRHRGRGRLAVRARDRDRALHPRQLAEQVRAVKHRRAGRAGGLQLGVVLGDRRGDDHLGAGREVGGVVAGHGLDPVRPQALQGRRVDAVRAGHARAQRVRHLRQAAHPGAADPDEVQAAAGEGPALHR